jgi:hypothetical protein
MLAKLVGFLLLLLAFGAVQANADSIFEITGTMTVPGNSSNPGVSETMNFSFELDYSQLIAGFNPTVVGTPVVTSFGPLGDFSLAAVIAGQGYIAFLSPLKVGPNQFAEMDLMGSFSPAYSPIPIVNEGYGGAWLYSCKYMSPGPCAPFDTGQANIYGTANDSVYAVSTPEPGTLSLCVLGALALCLMKKTLTH